MEKIFGFWILILLSSIWIFSNFVQSDELRDKKPNVLHLFTDKSSKPLVIELNQNVISNVQPNKEFKFWSVDLLTTDGSFFVSGIKIIRSRSQNNDSSVEYRFVWKNKKGHDDRDVNKKQVCFPSSSNNWFSTFVNAENYDFLLNFQSRKVLTFTSLVPSIDVLENLFFNTNGYAIALDDLHPWQIEFGNDSLCFTVERDVSSYVSKPPTERLDHYYHTLEFRILVAGNIREVHQSAIYEFGYIKRSESVPDEEAFSRIVWPIIRPKDDDQRMEDSRQGDEYLKIGEKLESFPNSIIQLEKWQTLDANFGFGQDFLNDAQALQDFNKFHKMNHLKICLQIDPGLRDDLSSDQYLGFRNELKPELNGSFGPFDFSDPKTVDYFVVGLRNFAKTFNIDSIYCEATEESFVVEKHQNLKLGPFSDEIIQKYPNFIKTQFGSSCASKSSISSTIRLAYKSQSLNTFVRLEVLYSNNHTNDQSSLHSLISKSLIMSLAGYQFIAPVVVYQKYQPDLVWYIRWLQAVTFMPQMSVPSLPWTFLDNSKLDNSLVDIEKILHDCIELRNSFVIPEMMKLASNWTLHGQPIIRPMWYAEPENEAFYNISDQFMLGEDIVVAPVVHLSEHEVTKAGKRVVHLPTGQWYCKPLKRSYSGPDAYTLQVPIDTVLYFTRVR